MKLKPKDLSKIGITDNVVRSLIIDAVAHHCKHDSTAEILTQIANVANSPQDFYDHHVWWRVAQAIRATKCYTT